MQTNNTTQLQMQDLVLYAQGMPPLPENKQKVWNLIGQGKMAMDTALTKTSLVLQQCLDKWQEMDQPALEKALASYKSTYSEMVEGRKKFTTFLDSAKDMCMTVERQWDPKNYEPFKLASAKELELRESAMRKVQAEQAKTNEINNFRTFITNEYHEMVSGYRSALAVIVQNAYNSCLQQRTPVENVGTAINAAVAAMREVRPRNMNKMERKYTTDEEAMKIFDSVTKPNYQNVFNEAIDALKAKFSLYANDLANADKALVQQQELFNQEQAKINQQAEAERAANTLMAQATTASVIPAGMKGITETDHIIIPSVQDWAWECKIMVAFLANFQAAHAKVKTKKSGALTTEQMAKALDAAGIRVDGLEYHTLKK